MSRARTTPEIESTDDVRIAMGAEKLRNSASSTPKTSASARSSTLQQIAEGLLLLLVGAAVFDADDGGRCMSCDGAAEPCCMAVPRSDAFEAAGDDDQALQVFAANFVLRRKLRDLARVSRGSRCGRWNC